MSGNYLVVFDAGTGGGRCTVFDATGRQLISEYREWRYRQPKVAPDAREFSPDQFFALLADACRTALAKAEIAPAEVAAVTATSQREGCVFLDAAGQPLYAGPNMDWRAQEEANRLAESAGEEIYRFSGHWPHAMFPACRLLWFKKREPELFERIARVLMINDWVLYELSGSQYSEPSNAGETLLFDITRLTWHWDFISELGLKPTLLCDVVPPGTAVGQVTSEAAAATGLLAGTPVVVGGADTQMALAGSGVVDDGGCAVSGTSTPLQVATDKPVLDPKHRLWSGCHVFSNRWVLEGNAKGTGVIYRWFRDEFYGSDVPFEQVNEDLKLVSPGSGGLLAFLGSGVGLPPQMPFPPSVVYGWNASYEKTGRVKAELGRSILEAIAYAVAGNADILAQVLGKKDPLIMCGGGTRGGLLPAITASVLEEPVSVNPVDEATSLGAAIFAAAGAGLYPDARQAAAQMVPAPITIDPDPKASAVYKEAKERWIKLFMKLTQL